MGKNQQYKAMQRARLGANSAGGDEIEDGMDLTYQMIQIFPRGGGGDAAELVRLDLGHQPLMALFGSRICYLALIDQVDGSFHSPEWHAARLAGLKTSHTVTWEEFKKKQKEDEMRKGELEADKDRMMREYRAQLDAERAIKLAKGRNHLSSTSRSKKDSLLTVKCALADKDKDSKKRRSKKRKRSRRSSGSCSSSESSSGSDDEEETESRKSKSRSKKRKKENKHRSRSKHSSSDDGDTEGPLPLSRFFGRVKS
ncbi:hypothetical protein Acr_02g0010780 [Actinidia rufa]|uniref:Uncharacterized protein n=1 Tax=Actinidia rufa TaxID=165716 RepID=A0A7J0E8Q6_9ERIC|nr:hypothetical protein Acr_02g0010780 [Actinidia rufa]